MTHGRSRSRRGSRGRGASTHQNTYQRGGNHNNHAPQRGTQRYTQSNPRGPCGKCGYHHPPKQCPAFGKVCNNCHLKNHFAKVCRQKSRANVYDYECVGSGDTDDYEQYELSQNFADAHIWCNTVSVKRNMKQNWSKNVYIKGNGHINFKLDTGAETSVMSHKTYESMRNKPPLLTSGISIYGLGEQPVHPIGKVQLVCVVNDSEYHIQCEILDNVPNLLCLSDCIKMDLIRLVNTNTTAENVQPGSKPTKIELPESVKMCKHESAKQIIVEYSEVFSGVGKVPGVVSLKVDPTVTPIAHPPRPVPAALRDKVRLKLRELEELDIIEKIPTGTPTPWCSAMHVVPKKDGQVRITIDPRELNKALLREYHPTNTVEEIAQRINGGKYMTVLDANQGYFQLVLDSESKDYTAFNTPFGRYRYKRLPMGITSAPELFMRAFGDIFQSVDSLENIMDDFLIAENTLEDHNKVLRQTLQTAKENNVTFSLKKLQLCTDSVKYSGHEFTAKGLEIDQDRVRAIIDMPEPSSVENVRTFLGMVTYVSKHVRNLSAITEPLRSLIKEANQGGFKWHFDEVHQESFNKIKEAITTAPVLRYYSREEPVVISCDASQSGLGCVVLQNDLPVHYGSRALTDAEFAYAQIEKELLAIVFAMKKFHTYIYGRSDVTVETDHQPLVRILEKPLYQVPLRLQKMRMRLQGYDFKLVYRKGTEIPVADALSRAYIKDTSAEVHFFEVTSEEVISMAQLSTPRIKQIKLETSKDETLQEVIKTVTSPDGWPEHRSEVHPVVKPYFDFQEELSVIDGILYKGQRLVIPTTMRHEALQMIHQAHQGMVKSKQLARDLLYWPGINKQIEDTVARCSACQEYRNSQQKEPLLPTPVPTKPWEHVGEDLFDCIGSKWLILVDYYSEYFEIERMDHGTHGAAVIKQSKKWFSIHGIPDELTSDNGPPWNGSEWKNFSKTYGFRHNTISPTHSQANGMVEKAVGIAKSMLTKCKETNSDPYLALLNIRNTPRDDKTGSPVQRLFSRRTRTNIPTANEQLIPKVKEPERVYKQLYEDRHVKARKYYDRNAKPLKPLEPGSTIRVRIGKTWQPALLLPQEPDSTPRSYKIQMPSGRVTRRNRKHLLNTTEHDIYKHDNYDALLDSPDILYPKGNQNGSETQLGSVARATPQRSTLVRPRLTPVRSTEIQPLLTSPSSPQIDSPSKVTNPVPHFKPAQKPSEITRSGRMSKPPAKLADFVT